mgnify:CR=1 FL=1
MVQPTVKYHLLISDCNTAVLHDMAYFTTALFRNTLINKPNSFSQLTNAVTIRQCALSNMQKHTFTREAFTATGPNPSATRQKLQQRDNFL